MHGGTPRAPLEQSLTSRPFERIAVDILGPLPETGLRNKYIMVVGDYFSKWTEAFPLPNQEAKTIARVLTEEWVCRFGVPRSLHSDQGRNFESKLFRELCELLQIHKTRTTPYHPQSDGLVERFNRTLLTMLTFFVEDNQLNWDALLPYVMLAYRSSVHASTSVTPYKVLFGREIVLPVDVMLGLDQGELFASVDEYVTGLQETLTSVVEAVKRHQSRAAAQQKRAYDFRATCQFYSEGELVWVRNKLRRRGVCPKLQRRYKGPFRVLERLTDVLYRLIPVEGGPEKVIHFNRLKPCTSLSAVAAPLAVGSRERARQSLRQQDATWEDTSRIHHWSAETSRSGGASDPAPSRGEAARGGAVAGGPEGRLPGEIDRCGAAEQRVVHQPDATWEDISRSAQRFSETKGSSDSSNPAPLHGEAARGGVVGGGSGGRIPGTVEEPRAVEQRVVRQRKPPAWYKDYQVEI
uniref:Integrase catalytic domain-containing protein n=1 Tax=Nothobranchius furzeri TaxID=105023 RepID=A0A8C6M8I5_NOTFU